MSATTVYEMKPVSKTWLGQAATRYEFRTVKSDPDCRRVVIMVWDDGIIETRHIVGDGRTDTFVNIAEETFPDLASARAWADEALNA